MALSNSNTIDDYFDHVFVMAGDDENSSERYPYVDFTQLESVRISFIVGYLIIIVCAILGNALVLITVLRYRKRHNSVNFLTCSLAASDMLVGAFVAPAKLVELTGNAQQRIFGEGLCTCLQFTQSLAVFSTVMTLLTVATERYFVIVYPLRSRRLKKTSRMKRLLLVSWIIAFFLSSPNLIPAKHFELELYSEWGAIHRSGCKDDFELVHGGFRQGYFFLLTIMLWLVPGFVVSYVSYKVQKVLASEEICLSEGSMLSLRVRHNEERLRRQMDNRRRVASMMIIVNLGFLACWSPYFVITFVTEFVHDFFEHSNFYFTMLCISGCVFLNSAINPFIYMIAPRFRKSCLQTLRDLFTCFRSPPPTGKLTAETVSLSHSFYFPGSANSSFYHSSSTGANRSYGGTLRASSFHSMSTSSTCVISRSASARSQFVNVHRTRTPAHRTRSHQQYAWHSGARDRRRSSSLPNVKNAAGLAVCRLQLHGLDTSFGSTTGTVGSHTSLTVPVAPHVLRVTTKVILMPE